MGLRTTPEAGAARPKPPKPDAYAWIALANTTAAIFMAALDGSIVIIALPAIFRGINLDPLSPGNISYLLWMIMGYRLVQAVLVVNLGRLGDMFGRVKMYNAGFVVFTAASVMLSFDPFHGGDGAMWLIGWRLVQAFGGSMLMANSAAILTDAFPAERRGFALGTNQIAALAGMFIGLVAGDTSHKPSPASVVISAKLKSRVRRLGNCTRILGGVSANDFWQTVKTIEFFNGSKGGLDASKTETFVSRNGDQTTLREAVWYSVAVTLTDKRGTSLPYVVLGTDYYKDPTVSTSDVLLHEALHFGLNLGDSDLKNYLSDYGFKPGYGGTGGSDDITQWLKANCPDLRKNP